MIPRKAPAKRTAARTNKAPSSEKTPPDQGKEPAPKRTRSAPKKRAPARTGRAQGAGDQLRAELTKAGDPYGVTVLITQAARVADRLAQLDRINSGADMSWLRLDMGRVSVETGDARRQTFRVDVTVKLDASITEERQQSALLAKLLGEIAKQRPAGAVPPGGPKVADDLEGLDDDDG